MHIDDIEYKKKNVLILPIFAIAIDVVFTIGGCIIGAINMDIP